MHNNNINTLRFLGALLVLIGHTFELSYGIDPVSRWLMGFTAYQARLPGIGVAMFFVLSGYLVTRSYENRHSLLAFVEARVLRIFPALWLTLVLTVLVLGPLVSALEPGEYFLSRGTWNYLVYNARLFPDVMHRLPGVFLDNPRAGGVNGSLWTLPVEVRMYVLVALLGVTGVLRSRLVFNVVAVAIVVYYLVAPDYFYLLYQSNHERLGLYFLLGALFYMNRDSISYHWIGVVILGLLVILDFKKFAYNVVFAIWFSYLVLYVSFHQHIRLPDLARYGDFSYGLYLYAFPLAQLNILIFGPGHPGLMVAITFAAALLFSILSWFVIEQPALALKGRMTGAVAAVTARY